MKKLCCLLFVLALLIPVAVYAVDENHTHYYVPADKYKEEWDMTQMMHAKYHLRLHTCSCGESYYERFKTVLAPEMHVTQLKSQVHNPKQTHTYTYMCTICPYTYSETIECFGPPCVNHVAATDEPFVAIVME